jgi:hypothetical protein
MTTTAIPPRASAYRGGLRWWTELPLIIVVYGLYTAGRLFVRSDVTVAMGHGVELLRLETDLHLAPERWLNSLLTKYHDLGVPADFWYASLHYLVTPLVLVWLWRRRPSRYRFARTWLLISTLVGLLGFTLMPTAPPRLLPSGHGFTDTMALYGSYGWWGADASAPRGLGGLTNQYAAMPSLHVGWALWCGIMLFRYGRSPLVRALGVLYPLGSTLVVMGTANHYLLDAVAGVAVMGVGHLLTGPAFRLTGARRRLAGTPAPVGAPTPPALRPVGVWAVAAQDGSQGTSRNGPQGVQQGVPHGVPRGVRQDAPRIGDDGRTTAESDPAARP